MNRPPAFPPSGPRQRPRELEAELRRYASTGQASQGASTGESGDGGAGTEGKRSAAVPAAIEVASRTELAPAQAHIPAAASPVSLRLRERIAELHGARRRARLRTAGIVSGALAIVLFGVWLIAFSPFFAFSLAELRVSGTSEYVSNSDVSQVLAPHEGTALVRLDTQAIAQELEQNHAVKEVEFEKAWPSGLHVRLTPRVAVAATPGEDGFFIIDGEGVELAHVTEPALGLPVIEITRDADGLENSIMAVLHVMDALPPDILEQVADVGARTATDVRFTLANGAEVIWGSAEDSELKATVLELLLQNPAKVYNVTTPMTPITS